MSEETSYSKQILLSIPDIDMKLAFSLVYHTFSELKSRLEDFSEEVDPFKARATFLVIKDQGKVDLNIYADGTKKEIEISAKSLSEDVVNEFLKKSEDTIKRLMEKIKRVNSETKEKIRKLIEVEKGLDEGIKLLGDKKSLLQNIYYIVASSRETLYKILDADSPDPVVFEMGAFLERLISSSEKQIRESDLSEIGLTLLKWKKHIKNIVENMLNTVQ
ncbi:MAG: hypothetical protein ACTSSJ_01475 [Candidatus Odinarchaeia archaeon]